jgi:inhibitor of cysteine peptidase
MAACLAIGWAATGCGQPQMDHAHTALTADDDGRSATLKVGEAVTVTLPENASTGYRWAIDSADPALITISEPAASYQAGAVGSGGEVIWTFVAKAPGATTVALKRWRHWEGDASVVQRFGFRLSIVP